MANAKADMTASKITSDSPSDAAGTGSALRKHSPNSSQASEPHVAAAAAIDALLASEARLNLQRARSSTRVEPVKSTARTIVPPARIVARPSQSPAWKAPFYSLAMVVGISTLMSAGAFAYLFLRPIGSSQTASDADIRGIRDSVAQLRRQVAGMAGDMAANRAAIETVRTHTADQPIRAPDRSEREQRPIDAKSERIIDDGLQDAQATPETIPEITGTLPPSPRPTATASREIIPGWHIRRAYDGVAVIEGKSGVMEVVPGQDVPAIGRIQEIKNENNRWQILTSRGVILSGR